MRSGPVRITATWLLLGAAAAAPVHAQVVSSEFFADPVSEGWEVTVEYCEPESWNDRGWYHQQLDLDACPPGPGGGRESYVRWITEFNGQPQFFLEFHVRTDGDRSEIPGGAPTVVVLFNSAGALYHTTVARDLIKFSGHLYLPGLYFEIEPGVPHTYRIELHPEWYVFYIDGDVADDGVPDAPFPAYNSRITWRGRSWYLPCHNAWDYIRYGVTPVEASGDYDSDGVVTLDDFYFFHECLSNRRPGINGGPGQDAGPGCRFADFNNSSTDLSDFADFQLLFSVP